MQPPPVLSGSDKCLQSRGVSYLLGGSEVMTRISLRFWPLLAGLFLTLAQIGVAVLLLAPQGQLSEQYHTLMQHDSYWFMNIVDRGYQTIVPPIDHKVMEVSNVGFFPAYPAIAALLHYGLHLDAQDALLVTAQAAACGFWTYFFLFCQQWNLSPALRFFGALLILAHPAAFFLITGYSESLFLMALFGFIYWSSKETRGAKICAALHGTVMTATRLVGIPCTAFPVVRRVFTKGRSALREPQAWLRHYGSAIGLMAVSISGAALFFVYCQLRWGRWDIYMLTQSICWGIEPDYLAVFKPATYRFLIPALSDPTEMSQMSTTIGALLLVVIAFCEMTPAIRGRVGWPTRLGIYFCAALIYYISVSGVASVALESMLRYEFCVHALIVLAFLQFLQQFRVPRALRGFAMTAAGLTSAAGLSVQGWYVWNFTRGNWVA
jgi:hypothetical protein